MKINEVMWIPLPKYSGVIASWDEWIEIKNSGKWDPDWVKNDFNCTDNFIPSLEGAPYYIGGDLFCSNTGLETLEGAPKIINGKFYCNNNELKTLKDIHKQIDVINSAFYLGGNDIKSNILGLLRIKHLKTVKNSHPAFIILSKHLNGDKDILECQEEMISAGYKEFAKL